MITLVVNHAKRYYSASGDPDVQVCRRRSAVPAASRGPLRQHRAPGAAQAEAAGPRAPPANRLEQLKGDRAGQWNLRVNDQLRICFHWTGSDAEGVEIVDYH